MPYNEAARSLFDAVPTTLNFNDPKAYTKGKKVIHVGTARDKLMKHKVHETVVTDVRSCEGTHFTLDRNGFQHMNEPTSLNHDDFSDSEVVKKRYWPEVMEILKKATGASHAVYESHLIRRSRWEDVQEEAQQLMQGEGGGGMCQKMDPLRATYVS
ncbi:hypothetical protein M409DRAFT_16542 [Zasmidium cellare ATCC 36951]|uniref:Uncharacterized protein n=1 Tax=Zasmidium cellare ATCC 36951 TaxID=1080233 RepID=A0A6A6D757_ZASCE|nr:uncharacterized protein M409DRAFT_16542 [Zasmidium cellare ATCC 36951]KAF2174278.1 hypothetical protein M409DRAFT_16542 [Zasmidium cellare ATCC 36951]